MVPGTKAFKKLAFLKPRSNMAISEFRHYWRNIHGPVVANAPNYARYRQRYVQNHVVARGPIGGPLPYAGMAEFWLPASNEAEFSATSTYLDYIRPDEERFVDMERTISVNAVETLIVTGTAPVKLVVLYTRNPELEPVEFVEQMSANHVKALTDCFASSLRGYVSNAVIPGSVFAPGARPAEGFSFHWMDEFWFDDRGAVRAAFGSKEFERVFDEVSSKFVRKKVTLSFLAEELVFFNAGTPTELAAGDRG